MIQTSARLLRLLSLLQSRRGWSGTDLADRLAVDVRTVRRDVDNDLEWLAAHIGLLGFEFRVDDPPELVDHLRALADRIHRAVSQ